MTKPLTGFHKHARTRDGVQSHCKPCHIARVRRHELATRFPACAALGVEDRPGGIRTAAKRRGFASAFEAEIASRLTALGVDFQYEGLALRYLDEDGASRRWTGDFRVGPGQQRLSVVEAKGRVTMHDQRVLAAVMKQYPRLDLRLILQYPHRRSDMEDSAETPAEWAEGLGLSWAALSDLERITADLPRVALSHDGDRIIPGWCDDGQPAQPDTAAPA